MSIIHIVSHTHWDREWYKPYQYFRVKLVYAMDKVMETLEKDDDFSSFLFDGQTVVLEDYLQVKPKNNARLKALIEAGRLIVGPWYTQPDEFAPDGESLIRNLLIGMDMAHDFGQCMMVGYLPDSFGQSGQMPQILQGFGIDSAVMMRGVPANELGTSEFAWEGINGETVTAVYLPEGYLNAMFLPKSKEKSFLRIKDIVKKLKPWASCEHILVLNGVDHQFIQPHIPELIRHFNAVDSRSKYIHSTIERYIASIKSGAIKAKLKGELIAPDKHRVHTSIASTRMYQKTKNRRSEAMIEKYVEPICAMGWLMGGVYPSELINQAWKYLFHIQAHDGICGCCTDEVHREIDQRFADIKNITSTLTKGYSRAIARRISSKSQMLLVFNNAMIQGRQLVHATIYTKSEDFVLYDAKNGKVSYRDNSVEDIDAARMTIWTAYLGVEEPMKKIEISFVVDFDCNVGYKVFQIEEGKTEDKPQHGVLVRGNTLENDDNIIEIADNGSLCVVDKKTGKRYEHLNTLEDVGDAGDTYNYSPPINDNVITSDDVRAKITIQNFGQSAQATIGYGLMVPERLALGDERRSDHRVLMDIETKVTIYAHTKRIDFETTIDNTAYDHRLRVLFDSGVVSEYAYAETQFGTVKRSNSVDTAKWEEEKWSEKPLPIYPMQRFVSVHDGEYGLTVLNRGLTEYEVYKREHSMIAVTLFRGVGSLGKGNLAIRPGRPSGIEEPTPDAQCRGTVKAEYAIITHAAMDDAMIHRYAARYDAYPLAVQNRIEMKAIEKTHGQFIDFMDYESLTSRIEADVKPQEFKDFSLITVGDDRLIISAVKKHEHKASLIVRLYNPTKETVQGASMALGMEAQEGYAVGFDEKRIKRMVKGKKGVYILPSIPSNTAKTFEFIISKGIGETQ